MPIGIDPAIFWTTSTSTELRCKSYTRTPADIFVATRMALPLKEKKKDRKKKAAPYVPSALQLVHEGSLPSRRSSYSNEGAPDSHLRGEGGRAATKICGARSRGMGSSEGCKEAIMKRWRVMTGFGAGVAQSRLVMPGGRSEPSGLEKPLQDRRLHVDLANHFARDRDGGAIKYVCIC